MSAYPQKTPTSPKIQITENITESWTGSWTSQTGRWCTWMSRAARLWPQKIFLSRWALKRRCKHTILLNTSWWSSSCNFWRDSSRKNTWREREREKCCFKHHKCILTWWVSHRINASYRCSAHLICFRIEACRPQKFSDAHLSRTESSR